MRIAIGSDHRGYAAKCKLVEVLNRAGKKDEARKEFEKLRPLAAYADLDAAVFARLRPLADELGWPADWRGPRTIPLDVGQRPDLTSLGPLRWQPTPAGSRATSRTSVRRCSEPATTSPSPATPVRGSGCSTKPPSVSSKSH